MPGAQAEEPPADEERSEPVQVGGGAFYMAFKTTHNKDESLPQFMKSPQLIFSHKNR